jgi:hypothetical protein
MEGREGGRMCDSSFTNIAINCKIFCYKKSRVSESRGS